MTTWLDTETMHRWIDANSMEDKPMTILEQIQSIIDNDTEALQSLRRSKRKGLFRRVIKARRLYGIDEIPLKDLKEKIQKYVEEDHCYQ
jgi:hypothetical protein